MMAFNFGAPSSGGGGLFGASPAPSTGGGLFGSSMSSAFGSSGGSLFGAPAPAPPPAMQQYQQQQQQQQPFSGNTPYSQLPDNAKRAIDQIYQLMMQHRRTMALVKTMAPALLTVENNDAASVENNDAASSRGITTTTTPRRWEITSADAAAGSPRPSSSRTATEFLPNQLISLQMQIQTLLTSAEMNLVEAARLNAIAGEITAMAKMHGAWPIESIAARSGVALSSICDIMLGDVRSSSSNNNNSTQSLVSTSSSDGSKPASSVNISGGMTNVDVIALQQILDVRAARVDRIEAMPSPYFWEVLKNLEHRVSIVIRDVEAVRARLAMAEGVGLSGMGRDDTNMILANAGGGNDVMTSLILHNSGGAECWGTTFPLSQKLVTLARSQSDHFLRIAAAAARAHEGLEEVKLRYQRFCQATKGGYYDDPFLKADVEEFGREREMQHRILSEQMALPPMAIPTPAPPTASTSGLFGQQTSGGLFGAPAPSTGGGLFGAPAPAPATGGLFGSSAPAPSAFGQSAPAPSLFGAAPGGSLFGAPAPSAFGAPAPAPSNLFGSAPAPAFGVAPTTPASTLAPRKKTSASRSGGRRR